MKLKTFILSLFLSAFVFNSEVQANYVLYEENHGIDLGEEYTDFSKSGSSKSASKKSNKEDRSFLVSALLYIPSRVLDILDIFRFDVGVGPAVGAVVRVTPHAQAGMRLLMPVSLRAGLRGRKSPVFIEHTSEMGVGPLYLDSAQREPTPLEIGAGVDLFLVGFYLGISIDSIFDAVLGFVGIDISDDDL
jgi:hypothetical protein